MSTNVAAPASQKASKNSPTAGVQRSWWGLVVAAVVLRWLCQPPLSWWPLAFIAVVPLLLAAMLLAAKNMAVTRRHYGVLYLGMTIYWALTLQGLRHANPLIYPFWLLLAAYLAIYPTLFVIVLRRCIARGWSIVWAAPIAWVGQECIRNYMLTGISAAMLGHSMADVPWMIQIADLGGTYAVSLVVICVNVALACLVARRFTGRRNGETQSLPWSAIATALILVAFTLSYGWWRHEQTKALAQSKVTIALIGAAERVEYEQDPSRELELFDTYVTASVAALKQSPEPVGAVVWPESMYTGTLPLMLGQGSEAIATQFNVSLEDVRNMIEQRRDAFHFRNQTVLRMLSAENEGQSPALIVGCGVVEYGDQTKAYSGVVQIGKEGTATAWYGKNHLVMFGEYIPLVQRIAFIRDWLPPGLGLASGDSAKIFDVGNADAALSLCPNICIETAVERVAIGHLQQLRAETDGLPDAIVTVTNDAWFNDSSVVQHHKRCAQLVAVACRRPILSAANNGPTAWIDSSGQIVQEIRQGTQGNILATPDLDDRQSLMLSIGDWPARFAAIAFLGVLVWRRRVN